MKNDGREAGFLRIPFAWIDANLPRFPRGGLEVFLHLARWMDWDTQCVDQHIGTVAAGVGRNHGHIRRVLHKLQAAGLVKVQVIGRRGLFWHIEVLPNFRKLSAPARSNMAAIERAGALQNNPNERAGALNTPELSAPARCYPAKTDMNESSIKAEPAAPPEKEPPSADRIVPPAADPKAAASLRELVAMGVSAAVAIRFASQLPYAEIHTAVDETRRNAKIKRKAGYLCTVLESRLPASEAQIRHRMNVASEKAAEAARLEYLKNPWPRSTPAPYAPTGKPVPPPAETPSAPENRLPGVLAGKNPPL